jgi:hypothetical protein
MKTVRRFVRDESGITMGLAIIMIVLLGVMGAGLLTFVSRDLNTVVEENRGQRAFEVADAGIGAAKRQLASSVDRTAYDDDPASPVDDIQWSIAQGGLTLQDLDGDGDLTDSVNVTIEYISATDSFRVISDGTYRGARRKIEARFDGVVAGGGGDTIGHPLYYTPSDIRIENGVSLNAISFFSEQDILIEGVTDPLSFVNEYESSGGTLSIPNANDELCNWKSDIPLNNCFEDATGGWNTVGRTITKSNGSTVDFEEPGFAAEGEICGFPTGSLAGNCDTFDSAADGVYGYDSTTGAKTMTRTGYAQPWGNNLAFVDKGNLEPNEAGTITYPFPRPTPIPEGFKEEACRPLALAGCTPSASNDYFVGSPSTTDWNNLLSSDPNRIDFVDAQNQNITFNPTSGNTKGILVVWCGHLTQLKKFQGIILNLRGDGSAFGSTNCAGNDDLGTYTNDGQDCQCWMYAEGGTATKAGITLKNNSKVFFLPSGDWSFLSDLFEGPPPTSFELQGWRELYE